jgi:2-polyprenyl-6-methoxyphenol hydroxylase-like FAD-dependent oxidoreductase
MSASIPGAIVVGAGPAGLATAIALAQAGIPPVVYERRTAVEVGGSGLTLWPNAMRALKSLGVADEVRAVSAPVVGIAVRSWRGTVLSATDEETMRGRYGDVGAVLHRSDLVRVLAGAVPTGAIFTGKALVSLAIGKDIAAARFDDGVVKEAPLVVGADGVRSLVRGAAFGYVPLRPTTYAVWRGVADLPLDSKAGTLSMGRAAQFGLFPMTDGRTYWFASLPTRHGDTTHAELVDAFAGWHEPVQGAIVATDPASIVKTDVEDAHPLRRRGARSLVLVGDAAHPSSPALGQGACQAIEDGVVLGHCLSRCGGDVATALAEYERRRVARTNRMTVVARQMGWMGHWRSRPACWLRDRLIAYTPERVSRRSLDWQFAFDAETA